VIAAGGVRCRLYLIAPETPDPALVEQALDAAEIACFLFDAAAMEAEAARRLVRLVQSRGVACLVADDAALAAALGADGVHLEDLADYGEARRTLGLDAIVGVACGRSRDAAMEAGEQGADYVAFPAETDEDLERLHDWSTVTVVPCVAMGGVTAANAAAVAATGAEFLALDDIWSHPGGPAIGLRSYLAALSGWSQSPE
jgi:thiamine-phosphate pyrophosphorylase